jgi:hypothetical protein
LFPSWWLWWHDHVCFIASLFDTSIEPLPYIHCNAILQLSLSQMTSSTYLTRVDKQPHVSEQRNNVQGNKQQPVVTNNTRCTDLRHSHPHPSEKLVPVLPSPAVGESVVSQLASQAAGCIRPSDRMHGAKQQCRRLGNCNGARRRALDAAACHAAEQLSEGTHRRYFGRDVRALYYLVTGQSS